MSHEQVVAQHALAQAFFFFAEYGLDLFTFVISLTSQTTKLPTASHWVMLRLLFFSPLHLGLSFSVVRDGSGAAVVAFTLLFAIMIAASAAAFSVVLWFSVVAGQLRSFSNQFASSHMLACCVVVL